MLTAKLTLWDYQKMTKKGYPIKIVVTKDRRTLPVHLKRYSFPEHWDKEAEEPKKSHPDRDLPQFIADKKAEIIRITNYCNDHNTPLQQAIFFFENGLESKNPSSDITFIDFYRKRVEEIRKSGKSVDSHNNVLSKIAKFKDIPIQDFDAEYVRSFRDWALSSGMKNNGIHTYLSKMRSIFNDALDTPALGLTPSNPFRRNMPKLTKTKKKAIFEDDIVKIETGVIRPKVKLWLFEFYMGGMDFIDVALLRWDQYVNGRLSYQREKLRESGFEIDLKVFPKAKAIIDELGTPDNERIFSFIPHPIKDRDRYKNYRSRFLKKYLTPLSEKDRDPSLPDKRIYKPLGLSRPITHKSARHSFRSIGKRLFIDGDLLMELMGHEGDGVEYVYQDRFTQEQRDEAHARIINDKL